MAKHFHDEFVKFSHRIEHRKKHNPSKQDLQKWDVTLNNRFGRFIDREMAAEGIPVTRRNRSIIAMLTISSPLTGRARVQRACQYWANVRSMKL